jgi:hypothetical protein
MLGDAPGVSAIAAARPLQHQQRAQELRAILFADAVLHLNS